MSFISKQKFSEAVDLSHRFEPVSLYDNIVPAISRAHAIADLLESICLSGDLDGLGPDTLRYAGQAIRFELQDAQAMIETWQKTPATELKTDDSAGGEQ